MFYFLCSLAAFFGLWACKSHYSSKKIVCGEVIVSSKGKMEICIKKFPKKVELDIKPNCNIIPCNPCFEDTADYYIEKKCGKYYLIIIWEAQGTATLSYKVFF